MKKSSFISLFFYIIFISHFLFYGTVMAAEYNDIEVKFRIFDEDGNELNYKQIVNRMTNYGKAEYVNSGAFDLKSLKAIDFGNIQDQNGSMVVPFYFLKTIPHQGLMLHWNTINTGYSSFLLDNGGKGFQKPETYIFNERLAYDAKRQFEEALANKPKYSPSDVFSSLHNKINACFKQLSLASTDSLKGKTGQECIDLVAQGMTVLLREYGIIRARELSDTSARWGVTIEPNSKLSLKEEYKKIDDLKGLFHPKHRWARIIMHGNENKSELAHINKIVSYAYNNNVKIMGQLFDSTDQAKIPLQQFKNLVDLAISYPGFEKISAWEVGNEVNGGWLGDEMTEKIEYASKKVKSVYPDKTVCLTFYWYSMQDSMQTSLFNWIENHITQEIRDNIDCVALSIYFDHQPLGFLWDKIMTKLSETFPNKEVMVGELAFIDPGITEFFREGPAYLSDEEAAKMYIVNRYASGFATPAAVGGGFWWFYDSEMVGRQPLWHTLREFYCSVYPQLCSMSRPIKPGK